jgi:hypothetical protein
MQLRGGMPGHGRVTLSGRAFGGDVDPLGPAYVRLLVDHVPAAIIATDMAGVIRFCNRQAEILYGRPSEERLNHESDSFNAIDYLRSKTLLMVLDNCEHLLAPAARFVEAAVRAAPGLRVLATSREGLAVAGERLWSVPALGLPDPSSGPGASGGSDAVRLFVERATEASSEFAFDAEDAKTVAELCRRLDGIPLAIELAAARVSAMSSAEIAAHLDRRFQLLTGGRRTATTRQQTLRGTIDWSYQLLDQQERLMLSRLAVFAAAGFELAAAEAVVADFSARGARSTAWAFTLPPHSRCRRPSEPGST